MLVILSYHNTDSGRLSIHLHPCVATPIQLGPQMNNAIVSRQCQSVDLKHDWICESYLYGAEKTNIFPPVVLLGDFPAVHSARTI